MRKGRITITIKTKKMGVGTQKNYRWLTVSCGVLIEYIDKVKTPVGNYYEGIILDIREKDDLFEGQPTKKIQVKMKDSDSEEEVVVSFTKKAIFCLQFFEQITEVDILKPIRIGVKGSKENEKISWCNLEQGENKRIEKNKDFPKTEKIVVSGETIPDYTKPFEVIAKIMADLTIKLAPPVVAAETKTEEAGAITPTEVKPETDLPF